MVIVALSAFLPWVSVFGFSKTGIEGDGVITLVCALVGLALLALGSELLGQPRLPRKLVVIVSAIAAGLTALVGLADMNGAAAIGLYLTMFAGIAWVIGVIWEISQRSTVPEPSGVQGDVPAD